MPKKPRVPSYRLHRGSGQAVVVLDGRSIYLGKWNTPASHALYERTIAEWMANRSCAPDSPQNSQRAADPLPLVINEMILAFWQHAEKHYRHADGTPTGELDNFRDALRPLRRLYGGVAARAF